MTVVDPQPPSTPSPDLLGDLLGTLAIEGPPGDDQGEKNLASGVEGDPNVEEALALAPVEEQTNTVQVLLTTYMFSSPSARDLYDY